MSQHLSLGFSKADVLFQRGLAAIGLVVGLPMWLAIALAIRLDSAGPIFHAAVRVGRGGRLFRLFKFRTMVDGAAALGPRITRAGDPRVTRVGRFLRRSRIDELPQLWNVVRGEMRFVGPRPEDPRFVALYTPEQQVVLSVCPGITGPSQLAFFNEEDLLAGGETESLYVHEIMPRKLALDAAYARHHTFVGDLRIMGRTLARVVQSTRPVAFVGAPPGAEMLGHGSR